MDFFFKLVLLLGILQISTQISTPELPYYTAGVVEFKPINTNTDFNMEEYVRIIKSNEAADVDIIVFPEMTLSGMATFVPDPENRIVICDDPSDDYNFIIRNISCAAKTMKKYVVINLLENSNCTQESQDALNDTRSCASNGLNRYNTNVVFDRNGTVISRYRKFNLFGEVGKNTTKVSDISTFTTDFNVTFGHFICFDLMFYTPALEILALGITDIVFPTMWFSELPFLTAVQIQQNWAYTHNVNLLAAGANNPSVGSTGTGIYSGRLGPLESVMHHVEGRTLYVSQVPKKNFKNSGLRYTNPIRITENTVTPDDMMDLKLKRDQLDVMSSKVIPTSATTLKETLCYDQLCCEFNLKMHVNKINADDVAYNYRMFVFDGVRTFDGFATGGAVVCGLIACFNETLASCGVRFDKGTNFVEQFVFENILISGKFLGSKSVLTLPNAVDTKIMPLATEEFNYVQSLDYMENGKTWRTISYQLVAPRSDLLSFAIYGRNFDKDGEEVSKSTGFSHVIGSRVNILIGFVGMITIFKYLF